MNTRQLIHPVRFFAWSASAQSLLLKQGIILHEDLPPVTDTGQTYVFMDRSGNVLAPPYPGQENPPELCLTWYDGEYVPPPFPGYAYLFDWDAKSALSGVKEIAEPPTVEKVSSPAEPPQLVPNAPAQAPTAAIVPERMSPQAVPKVVQVNLSPHTSPKAQPEESSQNELNKAKYHLLARYHFRVYKEKLYIFTATHYKPLSEKDAKRLIVELLRDTLDTRGTPRYVKEIYEWLLIEPRILVDPAAVDSNSILSFENGMLDTRTGKFFEHSPAYFVTHCLHCRYEPGYCPAFDAFLTQTTGGDPLLTQRIWETIGYCLSPDLGGKVIFLFQGVRHSGKTGLSNLLLSFFDRDVVHSLDINVLAKRFVVSSLENKVLCLSPDLTAGALNEDATSVLKQLSGNDLVSSDAKYERERSAFVCRATFVLCSNHAFVTKRSETALMDRIVTIPFRYSVPVEQRDPHLLDRFAAERSAIAYRAIQAYFGLVRNHYRFSGNFPPNQVCDDDYSGDSSPWHYIADFVVTACEPNDKVWTPTRELFAAFSEKYPGVCSANTFSEHVAAFCKQNYGNVEKMRKRYPGEENPINGFKGLALIGEKGGVRLE